MREILSILMIMAITAATRQMEPRAAAARSGSSSRPRGNELGKAKERQLAGRCGIHLERLQSGRQ